MDIVITVKHAEKLAVVPELREEFANTFASTLRYFVQSVVDVLDLPFSDVEVTVQTQDNTND